MGKRLIGQQNVWGNSLITAVVLFVLVSCEFKMNRDHIYLIFNPLGCALYWVLIRCEKSGV